MSVHDPDVPEPSVRLRVVLALLRVAAGRRGYAGVVWHGAGFTYRLAVTREPGDDLAVDVDVDPDALGGADAVHLLREHLRPHP
jgi:hypothetical protein